MHALPPAIRQTIDAMMQRQLGLPALLFVASHQPLAFVVGQGMHLVAPLALLWGITSWGAWATLLSHPAGPAQLEHYVLEEIDRRHSSTVAK